MVRVNLIKPKNLSDQHLIAEYDEILMLFGYVRRYPKVKNIPKKYCLGTGHVLFFKNKLLYLKKRHELIKKEMKRRNFKARKNIVLKKFSKELIKDWHPNNKDLKLIKNRLKEKLRKKPKYYRYFGKAKNTNFFIKLINS